MEQWIISVAKCPRPDQSIEAVEASVKENYTVNVDKIGEVLVVAAKKLTPELRKRHVDTCEELLLIICFYTNDRILILFPNGSCSLNCKENSRPLTVIKYLKSSEANLSIQCLNVSIVTFIEHLYYSGS